MGKIRTRVLGNDDVEEKQKKEAKQKADEKKEKKTSKKSSPAIDAANEVIQKEKAEVMEEGTEKPAEKAVAAAQPEKEESTRKSLKHPRTKKYLAAKKDVKKTPYKLEEAVKVLKKIKYASFDESVELHFNVDEAALKGEVELPHSIGKTIRVKVVDDKVLEAIEKGVFEFDVLVSHPQYMPKLMKFAKVLGPKGLMPNPKAGTISPNPEEAAKKFAAGVMRWKGEAKFPLVHQMIGKISHKESDIVDNARAFIKAVGRPHIKAVFIKTTMSPSLALDIDSV